MPRGSGPAYEQRQAAVADLAGRMKGRMRALREMRALSQSELAARLRVPRSTIGAWETVPTDFQLSSLLRVARAVGGELEVAVVVDGRRIDLLGPGPARELPRESEADASAN